MEIGFLYKSEIKIRGFKYVVAPIVSLLVFSIVVIVWYNFK